jgi:hypothetical protein
MLSNTRFGSSPPERHVRKGAPAPAPAPAPVPAPPANVWKAMHKPKPTKHGEADEFFSSEKYTFCITNPSTPSSILKELTAGTRMVVQPLTMIGKKGVRVMNTQKLDYVRYGEITSQEPTFWKNQSDGKPWYYVRVTWGPRARIPENMKQTPQKTFTLQ